MNKRLLTPRELDTIHRQRMKEIMEQDKSLGFAEAMVKAVESEKTKKQELEAQDAKTLEGVGKFLEQFTEGDIYGDERTGDYMLFQMPPKILQALKQGKVLAQEVK